MTRVLAHGCFDLVHPGHLQHLTEAKKMGDKLIVSVTGDDFVNKGPGRPVFNETVRAACLAALRCVDEVYVCQDESALPAIKKYKPNVYVKGPDYLGRTDGKFALEKQAVEEYGGIVVCTDGITDSSTRLINNHLLPRRDYGLTVTLGEVQSWLDKAQQVKATVYGESIQDIYNYVSPAFKSAKENVIDYIRERSETYEGGASIVAAHANEFCRSATLTPSQSWSIGKTRWLDRFGQKLFEEVSPSTVAPLHLETVRPEQMAIIADFGHGMFPAQSTGRIVERLRDSFIALTVQANGTNWGFNLYDKWPRCDYLVLDHMELRLAHRDQFGDMVPILKEAGDRMGAKYAVATLGHNGCMVLHQGEIFHLPVLTDKVVDRIGAGDAFLGATASLACIGAPAEVIALVGNAAGAVKVGITGNARAVTRSDAERVIKGVLS